MAKGSANAGGVSEKKPKLGQNFLVDREAMQKIVDALGDISQATVMEIGPGKGALTDFIAVRAGRLIAVELDRVSVLLGVVTPASSAGSLLALPGRRV